MALTKDEKINKIVKYINNGKNKNHRYLTDSNNITWLYIEYDIISNSVIQKARNIDRNFYIQASENIFSAETKGIEIVMKIN